MCGRFTLTTPDQLALRFDIAEDERGDTERQNPVYNIAPSQDISVIVERSAGRLLRVMSWGFHPSWASAAASRPAPINARAETLLERPLFRGAMARGRCIIPADGFYGRARWGAKPSNPCTSAATTAPSLALPASTASARTAWRVAPSSPRNPMRSSRPSMIGCPSSSTPTPKPTGSIRRSRNRRRYWIVSDPVQRICWSLTPSLRASPPRAMTSRP